MWEERKSHLRAAGKVCEREHLLGLAVFERLEVFLAFELDGDALALDVCWVMQV